MIRRLLTILLVASCGELRLDVPLEPDTQTIVVGLAFDDGETEVHAFSGDDSLAVDYRNRSTVEITALTYPQTLCELMVDGGLIDPVVDVGDPFRAPLAMPARIFHTTVDGGSAAVFRELGALPERLSEFRYRDDPRFCLAHGGVYRGPGSCDCDPVPTFVTAPISPTAAASPVRPEEVEFRDPAECGPDATIWYGEQACTAVGDPCPPGPFPEIDPGIAPIYVDPSALPGGDGSIAAPFVDIDEAVAVAPAGTTIVLAKGSHQNDVTFLDDVDLVGACVAATILSGTFIEVRGSSIRNLSLGVSVAVSAGGMAAISDVVVAPSGGIAIFAADDAVVDASSVVVRGGFPGVSLSPGAHVRFDRAVIERPMGSAVAVDTTATFEAVRLVVTTSVGSSGVSVTAGGSATVRDAVFSGGSFALDAYDGAVLDASRVVVLGVGGGIVAIGARTTLSDVVVRDGEYGIRIDGGNAIVQTAMLEDVRVHPLALQYATAVLSDLTVIGSREILVAGSTLAISRAAIDDFEVSVQSSRSSIVLHDVRAQGTILVEGGRARLERVESACLLGFNAFLIGDDLRVDCPGRDASGIAMAVFDGDANVTRLDLEGGGGIFVLDGSMTLSDASIRDTPESAVALKIENSTVSVARAVIERAGRIGIAVTETATLEATDLRIDGIGEGQSAAGIECTGGAKISRFEIRDSLSFGIRMEGGAQVDLDGGTFTGNRVGVSYPSIYDLRRLSKNVVYVGNDTDLSPY